jgi:hypothetical protein
MNGMAVDLAVVRFLLRSSLALLAVACLSGCKGVGANEQRLVSKPNMLFSDSAVYNYSFSWILPQIETGRAPSGGGQASGCTSCR